MERSGAEQAEFAGLVFEKVYGSYSEGSEKGLLSESRLPGCWTLHRKKCGGVMGLYGLQPADESVTGNDAEAH